MQASVRSAKQVLAANEGVPFGIFGGVAASQVFPPCEFLNAFLMAGNDPCDQDERIGRWQPFTVTPQEHLAIKAWWVAAHPGALEDDLGAGNWDEWVQDILKI